jgi:hypothetical protein
MRAASRAAGRRARRKHRSSDRRSCFYAPGAGFHLLASSGRVPSDRRWPYRLRFVGVGALYGRRPSSATRPRSRDPRTGLWLARLGENAAPRLMTLATRVLALQRSPCVSERASSEVPGCGHASCRSARGSVPASARSLARGRGSFASHGTRLRCLGPKTVGGPPAGRSRRRGLGGSPSTRTKARKAS